MMRIELYRFAAGSEFWRFTSGTRDYEIDGEYFSAVPIERSSFKSTESTAKNDIQITVPRNNPFILRFLADKPASPIIVSIFRVVAGPTKVAVWKGRIIAVDISEHRATISCENVFTSIARPGLRAMYQTLCRHALYSEGCNVDQFLHRVFCTITGTSGNVLVVPQAVGYPVDFFKAGYIIHNEEAFLMILSNDGQNVTVERGFNKTGIALLYPGCDHTIQHCHTKFNNRSNFGGFPYIPISSPFAGLGSRI